MSSRQAGRQEGCQGAVVKRVVFPDVGGHMGRADRIRSVPPKSVVSSTLESENRNIVGGGALITDFRAILLLTHLRILLGYVPPMAPYRDPLALPLVVH